MVSVGESYPPFTLRDQDTATVGSSDVAGSWFLLYWYPKADTPGCTAQAEGLRDQYETFQELGCQVYGASFDPPEVNAAFRLRYDIPFRLLTDETHELAVRLGAATETASVPQRIAHLVDPSGTVIRRYEVDDPAFFAEHALDDLESIIAS